MIWREIGQKKGGREVGGGRTDINGGIKKRSIDSIIDGQEGREESQYNRRDDVHFEIDGYR